jgi:Bacterial PH domain
MPEQISEIEPGLQKALTHLQSVLIPGEHLEAWAVQRRVYSLSHRRQLVAATSGRLICIARNFFGGFDLRDLRWQDLEHVSLRVGIFAADLTVRTGRVGDLASQGQGGGEVLQFAGLRKAQAEAVYRICQAQDQAWREKRRIRELEELRARAGGIQLGAAGGGTAPAAAGADAPSEAMRRLQEAKQMLDAKLITDAEYEAIKARIFAS